MCVRSIPVIIVHCPHYYDKGTFPFVVWFPFIRPMSFYYDNTGKVVDMYSNLWLFFLPKYNLYGRVLK